MKNTDKLAIKQMGPHQVFPDSEIFIYSKTERDETGSPFFIGALEKLLLKPTGWLYSMGIEGVADDLRKGIAYNDTNNWSIGLIFPVRGIEKNKQYQNDERWIRSVNGWAREQVDGVMPLDSNNCDRWDIGRRARIIMLIMELYREDRKGKPLDKILKRLMDAHKPVASINFIY